MTEPAEPVEEHRVPGHIRSSVVAVGVVAIAMLALWVAVTMSGLSADNTTLQKRAAAQDQQATIRDQQVRDLAAQVRRYGGTPVVAPPPPAAAGSPGVAGQPGASGASGRPGVSGSPGASGTQGRAGVVGPSGAAGPPGQSVTGPTGPTGPTGASGPAGKDGTDGKAGADGKDGSPPSSWTFTYLGVTYRCTPSSTGSTQYDCQPT